MTWDCDLDCGKADMLETGRGKTLPPDADRPRCDRCAKIDGGLWRLFSGCALRQTLSCRAAEGSPDYPAFVVGPTLRTNRRVAPAALRHQELHQSLPAFNRVQYAFRAFAQCLNHGRGVFGTARQD